MDTTNMFFKYFFSGIDSFLATAKKSSLNEFLLNCSKSCSDSFSKGIYSKNAHKNEPLEKSLNNLHNVFEDFSYDLFSNKIHIIYSHCGCDLVNEGLIKNKNICLCSEKSLLYNWESIFGKGNVKVKILKSILNNDSSCIFEVKIKQFGHF